MADRIAFVGSLPSERPLSFSRLRPARKRSSRRLVFALGLTTIVMLGAGLPALIPASQRSSPDIPIVTAATPSVEVETARAAEIRAVSDSTRSEWLNKLAAAPPVPSVHAKATEPTASQEALAQAPSPASDEGQARQRRDLLARIEASAEVTASIPKTAIGKPEALKSPAVKPRVIKPSVAKPRKPKATAAPRLMKVKNPERPSLAQRLFGRRAGLFKPAATPDATR